MYADGEFIDAGGLISYGVHYPHLYYRAAGYVDRIFKGAKPADLPVEQPTRFVLLVNQRARAARSTSSSPRPSCSAPTASSAERRR